MESKLFELDAKRDALRAKTAGFPARVTKDFQERLAISWIFHEHALEGVVLSDDPAREVPLHVEHATGVDQRCDLTQLRAASDGEYEVDSVYAYIDGRADIQAHGTREMPVWGREFLAGGDPMQTNTWTDFVDRVAHTVGDGVIGVIHAETTEIDDEPEDPESICSPTFVAVGE